MKIEQQQVNSKKLIGLSVRTNNQKYEMDPATSKIGPLVGRYWQEAVADQLMNRIAPGVTLSAYTDYESDETGDYTYYIGEEVEAHSIVPEGFSELIIPAGSYSRITTEPGVMPVVVMQAWQAIWQMKAKILGGSRSFNVDFEVYDERAKDPQNTVLDIYIGIS